MCKTFTYTIFLFLLSCSTPKLTEPYNIMDTPDHHMITGQKLLEVNNLTEACEAFQRTIELDRKYGPGYAGLAICSTIKRDYPSSLKYLKIARRRTQNDLQKAIVETIAMRIFIIGGTDLNKKWLSEVKKSYRRLMSLINKFNYPTGEPYYYMGIAYMKAFSLNDAEKEFTKVIRSNDANYFHKAEVELQNIQNLKLEIATYPDKEFVRNIGKLDSISRSETAALLNSIFDLNKLFKQRISQFEHDSKDFIYSTSRTYSISDFDSHVLKHDIELVLKLRIRGLSLYADRTFRPDTEITRGALALVLEDLIIAFTGVTNLSRKYFGNISQFIDVSNSDYYFNAINVSVNKTELKPRDGFNRIFNPLGSISGGEALHILLSLKRRMAENSIIY